MVNTEKDWFAQFIKILHEKGHSIDMDYNNQEDYNDNMKEIVDYFGIEEPPEKAVNFYLTTIV